MIIRVAATFRLRSSMVFMLTQAKAWGYHLWEKERVENGSDQTVVD